MRQLFKSVFFINLCFLAGTAGAENCPETKTGQCYSDINEFSSVIAFNTGYAAIARIRTENHLVYFSEDGEITRTVPLEAPEFEGLSNGVSWSIRKLIRGSSNDLFAVGFGAITSGESIRRIGLIGRIRNDEFIWTTVSQEYQLHNSRFESAYYSQDTDQLIAVGRYDTGPQDPLCSNWSQGFIYGVKGSDLTKLTDSFLVGDRNVPLENRTAFYDLVPGLSRRQFVATGFKSNPNENNTECQDDAIMYHFEQSENGALNLGETIDFGESLEGADELGLAVIKISATRFLIVGSGYDIHVEGPAAFTAEFDMKQDLKTHIPEINSFVQPKNTPSNTGRDRYWTAIPLAGEGNYLVAGSWSKTKESANHGWWRVVRQSDDDEASHDNLTLHTGSNIKAAALGHDGRVFAVGTHKREANRIGWAGFIYSPGAGGNRYHVNHEIEHVTDSERESGRIQYSHRELQKGAKFRNSNVDQGEALTVELLLMGGESISILGFPEDGDLDLVMYDNDSLVLDISQHRGASAEYLFADLEKEKPYRIALIARKPISAYEVHLRLDSPIDDRLLSELNGLSGPEKQRLADQLAELGYDSTPDPATGFGSNAIRSIVSLYHTRAITFESEKLQAVLDEIGFRD